MEGDPNTTAFYTLNQYTTTMDLNEVIQRHGVDAVQEQFYLINLFNSQYDSDKDGDRAMYLARRLKDYHDNLDNLQEPIMTMTNSTINFNNLDYDDFTNLTTKNSTDIFYQHDDLQDIYLATAVRSAELGGDDEEQQVINEEYDGNYSSYFKHYAGQVAEVYRDQCVDNLLEYLGRDSSTIKDIQTRTSIEDDYYINYEFLVKFT